ncbi:MAG: thioredoxin family protein [Planctomycetota bacterium]
MIRTYAFALAIIWTATISVHALSGQTTTMSEASQFADDSQNAGPVALERAVEDSRDSGRPIMLVFTGSDWCPYCRALEREVFSTDEFKSWAAENVNYIEVDFPQSFQLPSSVAQINRSLAEKYEEQVRSYPTILFVDNYGTARASYGYVPGGHGSWLRGASEIVERIRPGDPAQTSSSTSESEEITPDIELQESGVEEISDPSNTAFKIPESATLVGDNEFEVLEE